MPLKILHVVQNYYPSFGGTQILFQKISEKLAKDYNDDVTVITTDSYFGPDKPYSKIIETKYEVLNAVKIYRYPFLKFHKPIFNFLEKLLIKLRLKPIDLFRKLNRGPWSIGLNKHLFNNDADVICASSSQYLFMLYPINRKASKPFVFMGAVHFSEDENEVCVSVDILKAIKKSIFYIANTQYEKDRLIKLGIQASKIKVVGCGVEIKEYENPKSSKLENLIGKKNKKYVGYVGRHEPSKGIMPLIKAAEILWDKAEDFQLIIAGSKTAYTVVLENYIKSLPQSFQNKITLITNFSQDLKVEIFNSIDIFVSVSTAESFGIVYLEAWACKKPVIGANIGAVNSVISNEKDGFIVNVADELELSNKILLLLSNEDLANKMGIEGYNKVNTNYTWDIISAKYRTIYLEAIKIHSNV